MHFEKVINLSKQDTIKLLSSKFKEENEKTYLDNKSLICYINKNGKIKIYWKACAVTEALGAGSINYDTDKYFAGKVIEINENQSKVVLDFVDKTKKNRCLSLSVYFPLVSILFICMWYEIFLPERLFLFIFSSILSVLILFCLTLFCTKPSKDDYENIDEFFDMVVLFLN